MQFEFKGISLIISIVINYYYSILIPWKLSSYISINVIAILNNCTCTYLNQALVRDVICIEYRIIQFDSPQKFTTLQWWQNFKSEQTTIGDQEILIALFELCITLYCSLLPLQMLDFKYFFGLLVI
jgi:hypothetical protein